jgi:hypothetical protein
MDVKRRYIKEAGYDVDDNFVEQLQGLDIRTGIKIAKFIENNVIKIPNNRLVSTVLGGVVVDDDNNPVTFVVEIIKDSSPHTILSDLKLIEMDEYLDLINLNKKLNGKRKNKSSQNDS